MQPMEVASSDDFQRLANGYFPPRRPFASDSVNSALRSRLERPRPAVRGPYRRKAATPADLGSERDVLPAPARPELMPRDLFGRYAADLLYDGWPRATAPRVEFARRVAAEAFAPTATGMETEQTNPRRVRERLEANLQEQGRFEAWLKAMEAVVHELTLHPRTFGVRTGEVELFQRSLPRNLASDERDAAIWWFVRDWRCCRTSSALRWSSARSRAAAIGVLRAEHLNYTPQRGWVIPQSLLQCTARGVDAVRDNAADAG